jgi:hypothetical protein
MTVMRDLRYSGLRSVRRLDAFDEEYLGLERDQPPDAPMGYFEANSRRAPPRLGPSGVNSDPILPPFS